MWKYISGVSKVVEEKKKEKALKATCDQSKEYYEKSESRTRKFNFNEMASWPASVKKR